MSSQQDEDTLHLILTKQEKLARDVEVGGCLICNIHEVVEFRILRGSKINSRITSLDFRRANFSLFRICLEESYGRHF